MNTESLQALLYTFFSWHPARIATFAQLIFAIIKAKTVTIKELALYIRSKGAIKAKIAKIERLLLKQAINFISIGKLIFKLLPLQEKYLIAIDRTNWQFGKKNLNFFVASIIHDNMSIPIVWQLLDKKGISSTLERKELIAQLLEIIAIEQIYVIVADREFIGEEWFKYLNNNEIPFAIRVKKNEQLQHPNGGYIDLGMFFQKMKIDETKSCESKFYSIKFKITCLHLAQEQLFIVSNFYIGSEALFVYKKRWGIERTFKALKSSGFNFEDTHITCQAKLAKLFAVAAIALAICIIAGEIKHSIIPIKNKNHGRKVYSLFSYGFNWLKELFAGSQNLLINQLSSLLLDKIFKAWGVT